MWICAQSANQWRSQNTANARAQRGHITFDTLAPPSFKLLAVPNAEETKGDWAMLPQKIMDFELLKSILRLL